jgi:hypothetical protein
MDILVLADVVVGTLAGGHHFGGGSVVVVRCVVVGRVWGVANVARGLRVFVLLVHQLKLHF